MRRFLHLAGALAVLASTACQDATRPTELGTPDPSLKDASGRGTFIVVFRDGTRDVPGLAARLAAEHGGEISQVYQHALRGFAVRVPDQAVAGLRRNPNVAYVEADQVYTIGETQTNATWGLDRIDQRNLPLNATYTYNANGSGVRVYILDTGIRLGHQEFGGRAGSGFTAINDGRGTNDCNGHGTHVAGTVGGATYGVAKSVSLVPVRVLNCQGSGTTSGVIAGIDWVTANHVKPAVANMSLGGGASSALDAAVSNSIAAGVAYAVSAGNSNANACNYSPARVGAAMTVGATTTSDARASYSNFGTCLDLFAPGSSITSAWSTTNTATNTISGTSMASPHVAGVAALVLQGTPGATPSAVRQSIVSNATTGKVTSAGSGSPNVLLYSAFATAGGGGTNPPPTTGISLAVNMSKTRGMSVANLSWSGTSGPADVYRDGGHIETVPGTTYEDNLGRGGGSRTYRVCNAGTTTCSNEVTVTY